VAERHARYGSTLNAWRAARASKLPGSATASYSHGGSAALTATGECGSPQPLQTLQTVAPASAQPAAVQTLPTLPTIPADING
jgi:hypothetical protein